MSPIFYLVALHVHTPHVSVRAHTHIHVSCCPLLDMCHVNSKGRPPYHQCTPGLLAMVMVQPYRNHGDTLEAYMLGMVASPIELSCTKQKFVVSPLRSLKILRNWYAC